MLEKLQKKNTPIYIHSATNKHSANYFNMDGRNVVSEFHLTPRFQKTSIMVSKYQKKSNKSIR